jgi:cysteinyl-tRNA synthetase
MVLVLYNTLGRKLTKFAPLADDRVTMYTCGPTVYNYAHIGNFRTFVFEDVLRRYLIFKGYKVDQVMNITDVEDRIIEGIKKTGMSLRELTELYTKAFMEDLSALNVQRAEHYPRATENIDEIVSAVTSLIRKGYAYKAEDGSVYFSIGKSPGYGELSGIEVGGLKRGARTASDHYEKMGANDFALWKAWVPEDDDVYWDTPLGKGRPGWHIECSVMAMKYLGETLDIHAGAIDLRFPHHENEIAQSEALTGKRFVVHWQHSAFLTMEGGKMSKSVGNIVTLRELLARGVPARAIRFFLISAHYREELKFSDASLAQATSTLARFDRLVSRLRGDAHSPTSHGGDSEPRRLAETLLARFEESLDEDLNTPRTLASFFTFEHRLNALLDSGQVSKEEADFVLGALARIDTVLGVIFEFDRSDERRAMKEGKGGDYSEGAGADEEEEKKEKKKRERDDNDSAILDLVARREEARKQRDYRRADEIRDELKRKGVVVEDTPRGPTWRRLSTPA